MLVDHGQVCLFLRQSKTGPTGSWGMGGVAGMGRQFSVSGGTGDWFPRCTSGWVEPFSQSFGSVSHKYKFSYVLKCCLEKLGLQDLKFSSHSFTIGAVSDTAERGVPAKAIMDLGW